MKARVAITLKPEVFDAAGREVAGRLRAMGFGEVRGVGVGHVFDLDLETGDRDTGEEKVNEICKALLSNPYIEDYKILSIEL